MRVQSKVAITIVHTKAGMRSRYKLLSVLPYILLYLEKPSLLLNLPLDMTVDNSLAASFFSTTFKILQQPAMYKYVRYLEHRRWTCVEVHVRIVNITSSVNTEGRL